jgi:superfamily II DNA or RNA helicase
MISREERKYQQEALKSAAKYYKKQDIGQLIMACGTGKTYTSYLIDNQLNTDLTLILFPSLDILNQFHTVWKNENKSLKTARINSKYKITEEFSNDFIDHKGKKVIFGTYQSINKIKLIIDTYNLKVDLLICDEAHRVSIGEYSKLFKKAHSIKAKKKLFMTATRKIVNSEYSMCNEDYFGKVFFEYNFTQAIKEKYLSDYELYVLGLDHLKKEALNLSKENKEDLELNLQALSVKTIIKEENINKMIVFSKNRRYANYLYHASKKFNKNVFYIDGNMGVEERCNELKNFKNSSNAIIFNCKCLIEGIDDNSIDSIYFIDEKKSDIEIIQSSSRALRKKDKKIAKFFVPIIDFNSLNKSNNYYVVDTIIGAFEDDITTVTSFADGKDRGKSKKQLKRKSKIKFKNVEKKIAEKFVLEKVNKRLKKVEFKEALPVFLDYLKENGTGQISRKIIYKDINVGRFQTQVRHYYKKGKLSKETIKDLEDLNFKLVYVQSDQFYEKVDVFIEYIKETGHNDRFSEGLTYKGIRIDFTSAKIRENYKKGRLRLNYEIELRSLGYNVGNRPIKDEFRNKDLTYEEINRKQIIKELLNKKSELLKVENKIEIKCLICNTSFVKNRKTHVCCSGKCRTQFHNFTNDERYERMLKYNSKVS